MKQNPYAGDERTSVVFYTTPKIGNYLKIIEEFYWRWVSSYRAQMRNRTWNGCASTHTPHDPAWREHKIEEHDQQIDAMKTTTTRHLSAHPAEKMEDTWHQSERFLSGEQNGHWGIKTQRIDRQGELTTRVALVDDLTHSFADIVAPVLRRFVGRLGATQPSNGSLSLNMV